jgi:signal transduction histidine kinase
VAPAADQALSLAEVAQRAVLRCSRERPIPSLAPAAADEAPWVRADPERLANIIEHLLRNAQDATPEDGKVQVEVGTCGERAVLRVADSGCGMEPQFIRTRLFRPFDSTKGAKGMGIGAYQVREYARALGGDVEVQSSTETGTVFSITLPLCQKAPRNRDC